MTLGIFAGIVVTTADPQSRGRVRLRIPQISGTSVSGWAVPVTYGVAATGDQVMVAFEGGDVDHPVYWPPAGSLAWQPLPLEAGWAASVAGTPLYRVTGDGMVELSGSVETAGPVSPGVTLKIGSLPRRAWPVEPHRALVPTSYRGAQNSRLAYGEWRTTHTVTSGAYATDPNGPSTSFVAPGGGQVVIMYGAFMQSTTDAGRALMTVRVTQGGSTVAEANDNYAAENQSTNNASVSNSRTLTGLTPGTTYTATAMYRQEAASGSADFDNKWLSVTPVAPLSVPAARVTVDANGDVVVLFVAGTAPPYDVALTGIRARIV